MGVSVISIKVPVLQAGQEYTQDKRDRFNVSLPVDKVRGLTWGDKAATLYVEESDDGSTWVATKTTAIVAKTTADTGWVTLSKRYYRFRIKNEAATQGSIILYQQIVGMGEYLSSDTQASVVVADHGIPGANPVPVELKGSLIADEEAVPVKRVGREYTSNTSSSVDNQEVPAGGFVNYKVDLKGYGHVVSSVVTSESAPNTNGNYKVINELGSLWGTLVSKDYTTRSFISEPLQILGDKVAFRYQNNSEAPVVLLRLRYYAF
jgi:hypothetical protein